MPEWPKLLHANLRDVGDDDHHTYPIPTAGLSADAVTAAKIAADAVTAAEIATDAVDTAHIATDAVANSEIAPDSITSGLIVDGAVGTADLADAAVTAAKLAVSSTANAGQDDWELKYPRTADNPAWMDNDTGTSMNITPPDAGSQGFTLGSPDYWPYPDVVSVRAYVDKPDDVYMEFRAVLHDGTKETLWSKSSGFNSAFSGWQNYAFAAPRRDISHYEIFTSDKDNMSGGAPYTQIMELRPTVRLHHTHSHGI